MPYRDNAARLARGRQRTAERRARWFAENGPCRACGSWDDLEVDHVDPATKVSHHIWQWSTPRREAELAKCQPLCRPCHIKKSAVEHSVAQRQAPCGTHTRYAGGCRCADCREGHRLYKAGLRPAA